MTSLALRGSRFHNGVSRIHGSIASEMERDIWPDVPPSENPIDYITNGVHLPSILATKWIQVFDQYCEQWPQQLLNKNYWQCIDNIPDSIYWQTHQQLKANLFTNICHRLAIQHARNARSKAFQNACICHMKEKSGDILVLGFARRFATYKRATLLFSDLERLSKILNNPEQPVVILFAGKAHPSDQPGQQLIKDIHELSERPEFVGKIILLEGYDLSLARYMIAGTDVWLNTPIYPLEACGTSGQKAAINGVVNLSVMDGWWAEGYNGNNGWAIEPHSDKYGSDYRNKQEASDLFDIIENEVIPAYFTRNYQNLPEEWLRLSKESMKSSIPQWCSLRMIMDYIEKFYVPAKQQYQKLSATHHSGATTLANWKTQVRNCWPGVTAHLASKPRKGIRFGDTWSVELSVFLNGLSPSDVVVECLKGYKDKANNFCLENTYQLTADEGHAKDHNQFSYSLTLQPEYSGIYEYQLRIYPFHTLLSHKFEMGYMLWL